MAKKSIIQDLVIRGLDPTKVTVSACGKFFEHNHNDECVEVPSVKNALVEIVPETLPEVIKAVVEEVKEEVKEIVVEAAKEVEMTQELEVAEVVKAAIVEDDAKSETESVPADEAVAEETSESVPVKKSKSKK